MTYFCFVESDILSVPHMEPLTAESPQEAREEALRLLRQHASGVAAHVFQGDERILTVRADEAMIEDDASQAFRRSAGPDRDGPQA